MSSLLLPERPLVILPGLAKEIGLNEAVVLQQVHYWSEKKEDGWAYNTLEEWGKQFPFWSENTIQRTLKRLKDKGLIEVKKGQGTNRTNYYRVLYGAVPKTPIWGDDDTNLGSSPYNRDFNIEETSVRKKESSEEVAKIWAYYVSLSNARRKEMDDTQRRVIEQALKVATPKECCQAIRALFKSDFHQKRGEYAGRSGQKYRAITDALKGRPMKGESTRQRIDGWLDQDEEPKSSDDDFFAGVN